MSPELALVENAVYTKALRGANAHDARFQRKEAGKRMCGRGSSPVPRAIENGESSGLFSGDINWEVSVSFVL